MVKLILSSVSFLTENRISYSLVGKDGNVEYTPSPGIFHPARNNLRRCFPACTVRMQVFNIAELNISVHNVRIVSKNNF
jgi:hypothetical protein